MTTFAVGRSIAKWIAAGIGIAAGAYATYVGLAWHRYGQVTAAANRDEADPLLDRFMPTYDVAERHHVRIAAPADITLAVARDQDLLQSRTVRAIFRGRELVLGSTPDDQVRPRGLLALVQSLGWGVLAEVAGREIVVGAVTKPWEADVKFHALPPADFAAFSDPDYVKIAWTLRADPIGPNESIFRTETGAAATDAGSRSKFRRYWALFSPGILIIRRTSLGPLKTEAELRARESRHVT
jgi:hypothetical protein